MPTATAGLTSVGRKDTSQVTDWTSLRYAVVDVEGNGHQPPELVEVAVVPIVGGIMGEPVNWLVRPEHPIEYFATRIHGLTNQDIASAPAFRAVEAEVCKALDVDAVVAHNAHVDVGALQRQLGEWKCPEVFDTLKLARRLMPGRVSYKLGALVGACSLADGLPAGFAPHRATYDALVTARLFLHLATRDDASPRTLAELRNDRPEGDNDEAPALF
jgi:DNA polymerase III epsilon subunit-like protein